MELSKEVRTTGNISDCARASCTPLPTHLLTSFNNFLADLTTHMVEPETLKSLTVQNELKSAWLDLANAVKTSPTQVHVLPSIQHAVELIGQEAEKKPEGADVLVTGSLHLIGGVFEVAGLTYAL